MSDKLSLSWRRDTSDTLNQIDLLPAAQVIDSLGALSVY